MIYELREYQPVPGQLANLLARFEDDTVHIWKKHDIRAVGFWTTLIGESSNTLTYMLLGMARGAGDKVDCIPK